MFVLSVAVGLAGLPVLAAPATNSILPSPGTFSFEGGVPATNAPPTNAAAVTPPPPIVSPAPVNGAPPAAGTPQMTEAPLVVPAPAPSSPGTDALLGAVFTLTSLIGFLLYHCGLTRAKNSGHTCSLLLIGALFALLGYWVGGFAVQSGGIGDARAALGMPVDHAVAGALDHELGFFAFGHHGGLMGSAGFFLVTDDASRNAVGLLFLVQAALMLVSVAAMLGATLERARLLGLAFCCYLIGVIVYPLLANWVWGGGWLAESGREFHLGNGFVDIGGAGVVHGTAGVLALVMAIVLGPRHGRFGRNRPSFVIPGHNVPFIVTGSLMLLLSWTGTNAFLTAGLPPAPSATVSAGALAAVNTLLAATGGALASFLQAAWQKRRPEPARLCRSLLGGAIASAGAGGLMDAWAAFVVGAFAALLVQAVVVELERRRIDDPVNAVATHGAAGLWGVVATGLFANGSAGAGLGGVAQPVRGFFFGGGLHQLGAQLIGSASGFAVVALLGWASVSLVHKILGLRADLADEAKGLDWSEVGALGYQGDVEDEE